MAKLIINGLSPKQAKELAHWYAGQGEQDAQVWFELRNPPLEAPLTDVARKGGCIKVNKKTGDVEMWCKNIG